MYKGANRNYKQTQGPMNLTDKCHFTSQRDDGRHTSTLAALLEMMRQRGADLSLPEKLDNESFSKWQSEVKERSRLLLNMPLPTKQPEPVMLWRKQRDGYRAEKWEYYPDSYTVVPFIALIPDYADAKHPVPSVMCMLGSNHNKEFSAGEEMFEHPNCRVSTHPDRNQKALCMVKNGIAAFTFDNPAIAETSIQTDTSVGMSDMYTRQVLCNNILNNGLSYVGLTVFHRLQFMDQFLLKQNYLDKERIGIISFSLGTEGAIFMGLLRDEIKAIVFNENLHDDRHRFVSITEIPGNTMYQNYGNWHIVPGQFASFGYPDMCAAFAPRHLALTEGGANPFIATVQRAYDFCGASDNLTVNHYTYYADSSKRKSEPNVPLRGLTAEEMLQDYMYVDGDDHSFRQESALNLLKRAFNLE